MKLEADRNDMADSASPQTQSRYTAWDRVKEWLPRRSHESSGSLSRQDELLAILRPLGSLRVDRVDLPGTQTSLRITRTANLDRLLAIARAGPDRDILPVWAEIWPSGVVLAGVIAREPGTLSGKRVLEIGPGVGVTAVAALRAGA
jgi:hypothetical protein